MSTSSSSEELIEREGLNNKSSPSSRACNKRNSRDEGPSRKKRKREKSRLKRKSDKKRKKRKYRQDSSSSSGSSSSSSSSSGDDEEVGAVKSYTEPRDVLASLASLRAKLRPSCFCHQALHDAEESIMLSMLRAHQSSKQQPLTEDRGLPTRCPAGQSQPAYGAGTCQPQQQPLQQQHQQLQQQQQPQPLQPQLQPQQQQQQQSQSQVPTCAQHSSRSSSGDEAPSIAHARKHHRWTRAQELKVTQELKRADKTLRHPDYSGLASMLGLEEAQVKRKARRLLKDMSLKRKKKPGTPRRPRAVSQSRLAPQASQPGQVLGGSGDAHTYQQQQQQQVADQEQLQQPQQEQQQQPQQPKQQQRQQKQQRQPERQVSGTGASMRQAPQTPSSGPPSGSLPPKQQQQQQQQAAATPEVLGKNPSQLLHEFYHRFKGHRDVSFEQIVDEANDNKSWHCTINLSGGRINDREGLALASFEAQDCSKRGAEAAASRAALEHLASMGYLKAETASAQSNKQDRRATPQRRLPDSESMQAQQQHQQNQVHQQRQPQKLQQKQQQNQKQQRQQNQEPHQRQQQQQQPQQLQMVRQPPSRLQSQVAQQQQQPSTPTRSRPAAVMTVNEETPLRQKIHELMAIVPGHRGTVSAVVEELMLEAPYASQDQAALKRRVAAIMSSGAEFVSSSAYQSRMNKRYEYEFHQQSARGISIRGRKAR